MGPRRCWGSQLTLALALVALGCSSAAPAYVRTYNASQLPHRIGSLYNG
jgi:hypothetical protein